MTSAKPRPPLIPGETRAYPVLPLRDIVVFPHMIVPLFVGREKSILALEKGPSSTRSTTSLKPEWRGCSENAES
jgi:ATP-dependent Lon protease